jgi:hypothetical protein
MPLLHPAIAAVKVFSLLNSCRRRLSYCSRTIYLYTQLSGATGLLRVGFYGNWNVLAVCSAGFLHTAVIMRLQSAQLQAVR